MLVAAMNSLLDCISFSSCSYISIPISERPGTTSGAAVQKPLVREPGWNAGSTGGSSHHKSTERARQWEPKQIQRLTSSYKSRTLPAKLFNSSLLLFALVTLSLFCGSAAAQKDLEAHGDLQRSALVNEELLWIGEYLLVDLSEAPVPPRMHLEARSNGNSPSSSPTTSSQAAATSLNTDPGAASSATAIPQPFDSALGNNFTTSCQSFFQRFLSNATFNACHPFSLLLQVCLSLQTSLRYFNIPRLPVVSSMPRNPSCALPQPSTLLAMSILIHV